jgi:hypothetical protein
MLTPAEEHALSQVTAWLSGENTIDHDHKISGIKITANIY